MAKLIAVTARRPFECQGRIVSAGEAMLVTPVEAAILNRRQDIRFGHPVVARDLAPEPDPPAVEPTREASPDTDEAAPQPRRRRRYRRRDLTAEPA